MILKLNWKKSFIKSLTTPLPFNRGKFYHPWKLLPLIEQVFWKAIFLEIVENYRNASASPRFFLRLVSSTHFHLVCSKPFICSSVPPLILPLQVFQLWSENRKPFIMVFPLSIYIIVKVIVLNSHIYALNIVRPDWCYSCFPNPITQELCGKTYLNYHVHDFASIASLHAKFSRPKLLPWGQQNHSFLLVLSWNRTDHFICRHLLVL